MAIEPVTREERFLAAAGGRSVTPPTPITRKEQLLQGIIDAVKSGGATTDVIEGAVNDYLNANPVQPGATTEQAAQIEQNKTDIADLQTEVDELKESGGNGSGQNASLSTEEKTCILRLFRNAAYKSEGMNAVLTELEILWGVSTAPTLTSISAIYSGGDVAIGTALTDLNGIVVTAHYSDGSTATLMGYTLSGEIAEGENTITVTYQGMTTTFVVNGYDDANTIVIVKGFLGNSSTATSAVESNPSFPNAWASTTAIAVNPGDTVTVNIDPANANTIGNVRIRAYDTDGGYVASSSNQNGAAYNVFTATVAGFVRIANTNTETCNPVSVVVENTAGSTTYIVSDQR